MLSRAVSCHFACSREMLKFRFQICKALLAGLSFSKLAIDLGDVPVYGSASSSKTLRFSPVRAFIGFPCIESKNAAPNIFAFTGRLLCELISFALQEESCVDKGFVIEPESLFDTNLSLAKCAFGEGFHCRYS